MRTLLSLLFLILLCTCVRAQKQVSFGQTYEFTSETMSEDRVLNVLLPKEYADSTSKHYPVIYLLDGALDEDFFHASGLIRYFNDHYMMPPVILVGIANVDRKRDFTYPSKDPRDTRDFPTTGGSAQFIDFLQNELTTYVEKTFRTTQHRTIVGQSLGGLLATEILLNHPGHYNDYVIVSPSLWWDANRAYTDIDSLVGALTVFPDRLFVSVGEEYPVMVDGSRKLARLMQQHTNATFLPLMDEDHNTILHEALYRALDHFYDAPVEQPYLFANAWNGLNIRTAPSLDSAVVAQLAYGQGLKIIGPRATELPFMLSEAEVQVQGKVNGMVGNWVYIGSDLGQGWVFDAYVTPYRRFSERSTLRNYALNTEGFSLSGRIEDASSTKGAHGMKIYGDPVGDKYIEHFFYEADKNELQLHNLSLSQAKITTANFLKSMGLNNKIEEVESWPGVITLKHNSPKLEDNSVYEFIYSEGILHLNRIGWFVRSMDGN